MRKFKRNRPTIGVLAGWQAYTGTLHSFLDYVYRGMLSAVHQYDCNLMIGCGVNAPFSMEGDTALPVLAKGVDFIPVGPWNCDGLVVVAPLRSEGIDQLFSLLPENYPVVFAGDNEKGSSVIVDNETGIEKAISHLVERHGRRNIGFIAGYNPPTGDSGARLRGYISGLARHGIPFDPDLVAYGSHNPEASYQAVKEILSRKKTITALVASNDESAVGAMEALRDSGLVVPQDVAVIGFDDRFEARAQIPLLTTVHLPMFQLGFKSVELLYQIAQKSKPQNTNIRIPTHFIVRESCGCLPGAVVIERNVSDSPEINPKERYFGGSADKNRIVQEMAEPVFKEMEYLGYDEVEYLCGSILESFISSVKSGNTDRFRQSVQQILEHVAHVGDDLYAWQHAITGLRNWVPALLEALPLTLPGEQIEYMLHQARIAISEVLRGRYSRMLVERTWSGDQVGQMTSQFFSVRTENEVYQTLSRSLNNMGYEHALAVVYESGEDDPVHWSQIKTPAPPGVGLEPFLTRDFPPHGMFPDDQPFHIAVLPLAAEKGILGYAVFSTEQMEPLGSVVRQLIAALRGARLYQEAITAQQAAIAAQKIAEDARKMAEEANEMKSRFLSVVSHELRTPLNLISGLSNIILEGSKEVYDRSVTVDRSDLNRIYLGAQHLEGLIRDVLDLARSDIGQLSLNCEPLEISEVLDTVTVIGEQLAKDKELTWQTNISPILPRIKGDRIRLRQVLLNLINNAVKFTSQGSVTLSAYANRQCLSITVQDTGLGIPPEEQSIIFDEFRQSRRTTARGFGGLGLGLAICRRLVEMHDGRIGVTSSGEEGAGSIFSIELPVFAELTHSEPQPSTNNQNERVLLLVKDLLGGEALSSYLSTQGFLVETHQADDCCNWLAWLQPNPPDKIVLDLGLTLDLGWEILRTLKENPATRNTPVLFYHLGQDGTTGSLLDLNFLTKPISTTELADALLVRGLAEVKENGGKTRPILVADDDPTVLDLHTRILESLASGHRIIQARNGKEAIDLIRREHPALVLLDLMMPEMDGFTVLEIMQSENLSRNTPVIVLTGQTLTEEDMVRLNCGVANVLSKGMFSHQETLEQINAVLERKRRNGTEPHRMVLKAMSFIHTHYTEAISRSEIASHVGVSERHLARCFQQEVGISPIIYLNRFRVKKAKELLDARQMNITEVAMEVGFSTGGYFTRVFRDEVGITPREYIRDR